MRYNISHQSHMKHPMKVEYSFTDAYSEAIGYAIYNEAPDDLIQNMYKYSIEKQTIDFNGIFVIASWKGTNKFIEYMINNIKPDINARSKHGSTPLMYLAEQGNIAMIKFVIKKGANIFAVDRLYRDVSWYVCHFNDNVIKLKMQKIITEHRNKYIKQATTAIALIPQLRSTVSQLEQEKIELKQIIAAGTKKGNKLIMERDTLKKTIDETKTNYENISKEMDALKKERDTLHERVDKMKIIYENVKIERDELKKIVNKTKTSEEDMKKERDDLLKKIKLVQSKIRYQKSPPELVPISTSVLPSDAKAKPLKCYSQTLPKPRTTYTRKRPLKNNMIPTSSTNYVSVQSLASNKK